MKLSFEVDFFIVDKWLLLLFFIGFVGLLRFNYVSILVASSLSVKENAHLHLAATLDGVYYISSEGLASRGGYLAL